MLTGHCFYAQNASDFQTEYRFKNIIYTLAADSMNGRYAGSVYETMAGQFLETYIMSFIGEGYLLIKDTFTYSCRNNSNVTAHNLWVWPEEQSGNVILLMAHYEHLPPGSLHSKEIRNKNQIHPGADDNASGTAMAVELFRYFQSSDLPENYQYALLLVSGHEDGLFGSEDWVLKHCEKTDSILMCLNFDMVGRLSHETRAVSVKLKDEPAFQKNLQDYALECGIKIIYDTDNFKFTDCIHFSEKNIFSLSFSTGIHNDYHKSTDSPDKINFRGMMNLYGFFISIISNHQTMLMK